MEVRSCSELDLERLHRQWPTPDDVAGAHFGEQQARTATFLVCWEAGDPLGWGLIQWLGCVGEKARAAFPHGVEVNHLQVQAQYRGRGAGSALLAAAEQRVRGGGLAHTAISVGLTNNDARRLYLRRGYQATGVVDVFSYRWCDELGAWHDEVESSELLVKEL